MSNYTIHLRDRQGYLIDVEIYRARDLNVAARNYILHGYIVKGYTINNDSLFGTRRFNVGTRHFGRG